MNERREALLDKDGKRKTMEGEKEEAAEVKSKQESGKTNQ